MTNTTAVESDALAYPVHFNEEQNNRNQIPPQQNLELFIRHIPGVCACQWVVLSVFQMRGAHTRRRSPVTPHHPNKLTPASTFVFSAVAHQRTRILWQTHGDNVTPRLVHTAHLRWLALVCL